MGKAGMRKRSPSVLEARGKIWNSMRILRTFTRPDLVATAEASPDNVKKYVSGLREAGYLALAGQHQSGQAGSYQQFRLVRNTGPVAPRLSAAGLYDANLADATCVPPTKRMQQFAQALHKQLREMVDAAEAGRPLPIAESRALLDRCLGGRR